MTFWRSGPISPTIIQFGPRVSLLSWKTRLTKPLNGHAAFKSELNISVGLRSAVHGRYLLLFRELEDEVRIVRVVHGARNIPSLFE
jgi:plasmid stabilization system protein ParE